MDFATCPSCQQSVLDDDADICPFCGASMKAKPGAKPPAKPGAKPGASSAVPASSAGGATSAGAVGSAGATGSAAGKPAGAGGKAVGPAGRKPVGAAKVSDELPFDADVLQPADVISATASPSKQRTLAVTCPMCESVGYVPAAAAGKAVRCAKPDCLVPVFTAPAPQAAPPPPLVKKPAKNNLVIVAAVTTALMCVGGGVAYVMMGSTGPTDPNLGGSLLTPEKIAELKNKKKTAATTDPTGSGNDSKAATDDPAATAGSTNAGQPVNIAALLKLINESALVTSTQNRSKTYCRRLASEAFAWAGDVQGARSQLASLAKVGPEVPFLRVSGLVELSWAERQKPSGTAAKDAVEQALQYSKRLPTVGRDQLDVSSRLAMALAKEGRISEAQTLLSTHLSEGADGEFVATWIMYQWSPAGTTFEECQQLSPVLTRTRPQIAAAVQGLAMRGEREAALALGSGWMNLEDQAVSAASLAQGLAWTAPEDLAGPALDPLLQKLPAAGQAVVWSRAARVLASRQQTQAAQSAVAKAAEQLATLSAPQPFVVPELRPLLRLKPIPPETETLAAIACSELVLAELKLSNDPAAAQRWLDQALAWTRSSGPTAAQVQPLLQEVDSRGLNGMRDELKRRLDLRTDDEARQELGTYRRVLADLDRSATNRIDLQRRLLSGLAARQAATLVWTVVEPVAKEPSSDLAALLPAGVAQAIWEAADGSGNAALAQSVTARYPDLKFERSLIAAVRSAAMQGDASAAGKLVANGKSSPAEQSAAMLSTAIALAEAKAWPKLWSYLAAIPAADQRDECLEVASWVASRQGDRGAMQARLAEVTGSTEKIALARGLIGALTRLGTEALPQQP
jgi:hypothetical protein